MFSIFEFLLRTNRSASYAPLNVSQSTLTDTDEPEKGAEKGNVVKCISYRHAVILYVSNIVLTISLVALLFYSSILSKSPKLGSYENAFTTEIRNIEPDHDTLALEKVKFYGGILIDDNGTYSLSHRPGEPDYFGPPGRETDHAWGKILKDRFIGVLPKDWPPDAVELNYDDDLVKGKWWLETSGLHALHCLNYIRRSFSPEYYTNHQDKPGQPTVEPKTLSHSMHLKHCMEQLRQHLMCQLDMTPTPRTWRAGGHVHHADTDQWHVCRNFDAMRTWMYPFQEFYE